jgi:S1-C subfamily serine protease
MKTYLMMCVLLVALGPTVAFADNLLIPPSSLPNHIEVQGTALSTAAVKPLTSLAPAANNKDIPVAQLLHIAQLPVQDITTSTRSAKDAEIYRTISPSVVLVATKDGLGSGSLVSLSGDIITNWHVVAGYTTVAIVFKPSVEGTKPRSEEMKLGRVVKYDQVADLALVKAEEVPSGRIPIRLGDIGEIIVGEDVLAIGHPKGNDWSLTKGIISQYRRGYEWTYEDQTQHKADIVQTQTPINPGNSGGPLLGEAGTLIGVNAGKAKGENLNFAVSVDDVRRFLAGPAKPNSQASKSPCEPKEMSRFYRTDSRASIVAYDMDCSGKVNANYIVPDRKADPVTLAWDRSGKGRPDVIFFDFKRSGKWDLSFWDANFEGKWTLVGYHDDGSLVPTRFESYADFEKRRAAQR